MSEGLRTCPVEGCEETHTRSKLMCISHWYSVPKDLRDELWRAYRSDGVLSDAYVEAMDACIAAASER
jgi:hypothetical protein